MLAAVAALLVLAAGGLYVASRLAVAEAERRFPPLGRFVAVEGLRQHYVEAGAGPATVVLLHGANGALQDFTATVFADLARRYRTIAVDRPGHGWSERPAGEPVTPAAQARLLRGLLAELRVERPVLVAFSFGGTVALSYALEWQDEVAALVLLGAAAHEWPSPVDLKWRMAEWPVVGRLLTELVVPVLGPRFAGSGVVSAFAPDRVADSFGGAPLPLALRPASFRANAADINHVKAFLRRQGQRYGELTLPLELLTGDADAVVSPTLHSARLAGQAQDARLTVLAGAGHLLPYAHPGAVLAAIERAVERARTAGRLAH